ncbi:MAG: hypothetical protein AAGH43_04340 [Pseudomonadota bacterium]
MRAQQSMKRAPAWAKWRAGSALALSLTLAACGGGMDGITGLLGGGGGQNQTQISAAAPTTFGGISVDQLRADQLCPSIIVRDGTETLRIYARADEPTPDQVRYQAQILQTVVECGTGPLQFGLSIGVAGRVIIGPQGGPATLDFPIRIVVLNTVTDEVISSEIVRADAVIEPTEVSANFTVVNRDFFIAIPERQADYQVIVGFDEVADFRES